MQAEWVKYLKNKNPEEDFKSIYGLFLWYLKRPKFYPQFGFQIKKLLNMIVNPEYAIDTKAGAKSWCKENAMDTFEAISFITGESTNESIANKYKSIFFEAKQKEIKCPVNMGGAGNLDLLYWIAEHIKVKKVIETGVAYGWSSLAILLSLKKRKFSLLISTDMPYPNRNNNKYIGCVVSKELKKHWKIINNADCIAIPRALRYLKKIDMCHYDSDKSYYGRMWAYPRLWKALRVGGIFISDDIGDNISFQKFAKDIKVDPIVVRTENKYAGILIKN